MNAKATKTFVTRMRSFPILLGLLIAPAKMDLSGMDTRDQVENYRHTTFDSHLHKSIEI